jgi:hypothetical protein
MLPAFDLKDASKPQRSACHEISELARQLLSLHKQLPSASTDHARTLLQRQIDATDRQIDRLVYDLYGLTDDEIRIVEEATDASVKA